ncbi:YDL073W [Saccharomyces arboricola H-6]|uniref:YDL073W n=1 Tax=Saccharomyces arboricola (strain H-6 / AS 2.3317 / CBS 10644) TaxID=1160507 RepID=J8Q6X5_SACAR|nr:YDL073W [Saccharomyces arboricola H-6]
MGPAVHNQLFEYGTKIMDQDKFLIEKYETQLFQSLNRFISFINNADQSANTKEQSNSFCKSSSNFIRLKLLTVLRQWCDYSQNNYLLDNRDVLIQWWVTLLNFLNSDTSLQMDAAFESSLSIELTSVCLECVSRILTILIILPIHPCRDREIYSHHLLLTIHCITNKLILISKNTKKLNHTESDDKSSTNHKKLQQLNKYSSLLRSFIGKLNAYAFFYLPEELHFDTILLLTVSPQISSSNQTCLFPWKKRYYTFTGDQEQIIRPETFENKDTKFFRIIVSYIKNDFILMSFYWHYWYIILQFIKLSDLSFEIDRSTLSCVPGSEILLTHVTTRFLNSDLNKFTRIIKQTPNPRVANDNLTESHPNFRALNGNNALITSEKINDYIFSNFKTIKLWECLRSLSGCIAKEDHSEYLENMLSLHESSLMNHASTISAYDYVAANIIYNKILQFILFQFESLSSLKFIQWGPWYNGLLSMLRTKNVNCQTVSLLCFFNVWRYVPLEERDEITKTLLRDFWTSLTFDNEFPLIRILLMKLLIFKIIPSAQGLLRSLLYNKIKELYEELLMNKETLFEMRQHCLNDMLMNKRDALVFNGNSHFIMVPKKSNAEDQLVYKINQDKKVRLEKFPSVSSVANTRPNVILKNGKYVYDILDEMASKAAFLIAEKKTRLNSKKNDKAVDGSEDDQDDADDEENAESNVIRRKKTKERSSSLSATFNSWLSRFSTSSDESQKKKAQESELDNDFDYEEDIVDFSKDMPKRSSSSIEKLFKHGNNSGPMAASNVSINLNKRENILIGPPELRYSNEIKEYNSITTVFRLVFIQTNRKTVEKIDLANMKWGTIHGGSKYMKPLPVPKDLITGATETENDTRNFVTVDGKDLDMDLPVPDFSVFGKCNEEEHEVRMEDPKMEDLRNFDEKETVVWKQNQEMKLRTRVQKICVVIETFNATVKEYFEFSNRLEHDSIFIDFEVRKPSSNNSINIKV